MSFLPSPSPSVGITVDCPSHAGILFDWDGCLAIGGRIIPAAIPLLKRYASVSAIVSNNSTQDRGAFAAMLRRTGIALPIDRIVLAGVETLRHAAADPEVPTMLIGSTAMQAAALRLGINLVDRSSRRVLLLRDTQFHYARLRRIVDAIGEGAELIVANRDLTHPGTDGRIVPETGALLAAIIACVGDGAITAEIGKPGPLLYRRACAELKVAPADAVMIGDNPDTDIRGARGLGMGSILVGPRGHIGIDQLASLPLSSWPVERGVRTA